MGILRILLGLAMVMTLSMTFSGCGGDDGGGDETPVFQNVEDDSNDIENSDDATNDDTIDDADEGSEGNPQLASIDTNTTFDIDSYESMYLKVTTNSEGYYHFTALSDLQDDSIAAIRIMLYDDQFESYSLATGFFGSLLVNLKADTTYYIEIENTEAVTASCKLNISWIGTLNEGSVANPIDLTLEEIYSAKVGTSKNDSQYSYYRFTTDSNTYYMINSSDKDIEITLYRDSGFSDMVDTALEGKIGTGLDTNTTYYIKVYNPDTYTVFHDLKISGMDTFNEGTLDNPIVLTVDGVHNGKVGITEQLQENSYYVFTTDFAAKYKLTLSKALFYMYLYSDPSFDESYRLQFSDTGSLEWSLDPETTYYLRVENPGISVDTYDLLVLFIDEGTQDNPVNLALETVHGGKIGSENGTNYNYYQFTTNNDGYYETTISGSNIDVYILNGDTWYTYFDSSSTGTMTSYLDANTTYHLIVVNNNSSDAVFDLKVSEKGKTNEGDVGAPLNLALEEVHAAKVGTTSDANLNSSYYSFATTDAAIYLISTLNKSPDERLDIELFSDSSFSSSSSLSSLDDAKRTSVPLDANTTYYLKVTNYWNSVDVTYDLAILKPDTIEEISVDENDSANPVELSLDSQYTAHVGTTSTSGDYSYYSFTTGSDSTKTILISFRDTLPSADLDILVYKDAAYTTYLGTVTSSPASLSNYDVNSTYYFKIQNYSNADDVTYNLLLQVDP